MSGVIVETSCVEGAARALSRKNRDVCFATFRLAGDATIVLRECGGAKDLKTEEELRANWDAFVTTLPDDEPAWGVYHFDYLSPADGVMRSKTVFVLWCTAQCKVRQRMLAAVYAKKVRMSVCDGEPIDIQGGNAAELSFENVLAKVLSKLTVR